MDRYFKITLKVREEESAPNLTTALALSDWAGWDKRVEYWHGRNGADALARLLLTDYSKFEPSDIIVWSEPVEVPGPR